MLRALLKCNNKLIFVSNHTDYNVSFNDIKWFVIAVWAELTECFWHSYVNMCIHKVYTSTLKEEGKKCFT